MNAIIVWMLMTAPADIMDTKFVSQHRTAEACYQAQIDNHLVGGEHTICRPLTVIPASKR